MLFISKCYESLDKLTHIVNENLLTNANFNKYVSSVMNIMKTTGQIEVQPAPKSSKSGPVSVTVKKSKIKDAEVPSNVENFNKLFFNEWLTDKAKKIINANANKNNGLNETNGWSFIYKSNEVKGIQGSKSKSRGRSWGEKVEYIVCDAFNLLRKNEGKLPKDWDWSSYEFSGDMEAKGKRTDDDKNEFFKKIYTSLTDAGIKTDLVRYTGKDNADPTWEDKGHYKDFGSTVNNEAKTDIMTTDGTVKISMKKVDSDKDRARLASSSVCDSLAIITTAIENAKKDSNFINEFSNRILELNKKSAKTRSNFDSGATVSDVKKKVKRLLGKNVEDIADTLLDNEDSDIQELARMSLIKKAFGETILDYVTSDADVRDQLIAEALSGKGKFGEKSNSCANAVLVWNETGNCKLYNDIVKYVKSDECKGYKVKAAFKSDGGKFWIVMSIL
jgi:hypothetical protein